MTKSEFKDWLDGFLDGTDAVNNGLTKEQVSVIKEVSAKIVVATITHGTFDHPNSTQIPFPGMSTGTYIYGTPSVTNNVAT